MQYALTTLLLAATALAVDHEVKIGPGNVFSPNNLSGAQQGDTVSVHFMGGHNIAQSSFAAPCQPVQNGVWSGPMPNRGDVFTFEIANASAPMWFYCAVGNHCQQGMALAINPTTERTIAAYQSAAASASSNTAPQGNEPIAGRIVAQGQQSGSSTQSGTASQTSSTAAATGSSSAGSVRVGMGLVGGLVAAAAAFAL